MRPDALGVVGVPVPEAVVTSVLGLVCEPRLLVDLAFAADEVPGREEVADHVFAEPNQEAIRLRHLGRDPGRHR